MDKTRGQKAWRRKKTRGQKAGNKQKKRGQKAGNKQNKTWKKAIKKQKKRGQFVDKQGAQPTLWTPLWKDNDKEYIRLE